MKSNKIHNSVEIDFENCPVVLIVECKVLNRLAAETTSLTPTQYELMNIKESGAEVWTNTNPYQKESSIFSIVTLNIDLN